MTRMKYLWGMLIVWAVLPLPTPAMATDCDVKVQAVGSRGEPQYTGLTGYLAPSRYEKPEKYSERLPKQPWRIPLYHQAGPTLWEKSGKTVAAKTKVVVERQSLVRKRQTYYDGLLFVKDAKSGKQFVINHDNFVPTDYWNCPVEKAVQYSYFLAKVIKPARPIETRTKGRWGEMGAEKTVFCHDSPDQDDKRLVPNGVVCEIYKKYRVRYGGMAHVFPPDSLQIVY